MRTWSIPIGKMFGVEIRIHLAFLGLLLYAALGPRGLTASLSPWRGAALAAVIFAAVLVHELLYVLVNRKSGSPVRAVVLFPICGVPIFEESRPALSPDWKREARFAALGPFIYFIFAVIGAGILQSIKPQPHLWTDIRVQVSNFPHAAIWAVIWLGLINLLPAYPTDGGRVLRAIFSRKMDAVTATRRAVSIGRGFAIAFMLAGWSELWFSVVGLVLFFAAQMEDRSAVFQSVLDSVRLQDIMLTDFTTLSPADTLEDALEKAVHCLQDDFPVVRGSDMVGVVSKQKILQTLRSEGNGYVQAIMSRIFDVAPKSETLAAGFRRLSARNLSILPVVEDQQLVGIVTLQNLMHSMALLAETRKLRKAALES
jgi:Zn-dependent protease/predicted transcriptional regulator